MNYPPSGTVSAAGRAGGDVTLRDGFRAGQESALVRRDRETGLHLGAARQPALIGAPRRCSA
jgi:hypothetical protein